MKKIFAILILSLAATGLPLGAQTVPEGYVLVDSLVFTPLSAVDSTLRGESIWSAMPSSVTVHQSQGTRTAVADLADRNSRRNFSGYRIRIFFDNKQNARGASEAALNRFKALHPGTAAYRSFSSPFFKVTVGDYRTKSEALAALRYIKPDFPTAFIVREKFKYPAMNNNHAFKIDTIKILRPAPYGQ